MYADIEITIAANGKKMSIQGSEIIAFTEVDNGCEIFVKGMGNLGVSDAYDKVKAMVTPWPWSVFK